MFNHIYGSPFPTLNPRVRYKTALERAGFDVNYENCNIYQSSPPPSLFNGIARGRNASTGNLEQRLEPPKRASARIHSLPENSTKHIRAQPGSCTSPISRPTQRPRPPPEPLAMYGRPRPAPIPASASSISESGSGTKSEKTFQPDPIEKSFMMLTQNDTPSTTDQSANTSRYTSQEFQRDTADSSRFSERCDKEMSRPFLNPFASTNEHSDNDSDGLDIEPQRQLQLQVGQESGQVSPLQIARTSTPRQTSQPPSHHSNQLPQSSGKNTTNIQVENLIAQLDDVSFLKTEQLGKPSSQPSQLLPLPHAKNSSAYLSGFRPKLPSIPSSPAPPLPQSVVHDSCSISQLNTPRTGDTPLFYNFQKNVQQEFTSSRSKETLQIRNSQLVQVSPPPRSRDRLIDHTPDLEFKYPPGTGPCRRCGIEPTSKRIYSKKNNELSGQWHRDCFRCLTCNTRFNKNTPCYILDDKPYCRRHFHEENSSICQTCQEFIEGECIENDRLERFHVDCLLCFLCREPIIADYFIFNNELPLCSKHTMETLPSELLDITDNTSTVSKRRTRFVNFTKD